MSATVAYCPTCDENTIVVGRATTCSFCDGHVERYDDVDALRESVFRAALTTTQVAAAIEWGTK